jgi:hypothetical protein
VLNQAEQAFELGLADKALDILLASSRPEFGEQGVLLQIELALNSGRVRDLRTWFDESDLQGTLGPFRYHWTRALIAAATGDYATADTHLKDVAAFTARQQQAGPLRIARYDGQIGIVVDLKSKTPRLVEAKDAVGLLVGKAILDAPLPRTGFWAEPVSLLKSSPLSISTRWLGRDIRSRLFLLVLLSERCFDYLIEEAQVHALRGLLALEWGECENARANFDKALSLLSQGPIQFNARIPPRLFAEEYLKKLTQQSKQTKQSKPTKTKQ